MFNGMMTVSWYTVTRSLPVKSIDMQESNSISFTIQETLSIQLLRFNEIDATFKACPEKNWLSKLSEGMFVFMDA